MCFYDWRRSVDARLLIEGFDPRECDDWDWKQVHHLGYSPAQAVADFLAYHG